MYYSAIWWGKLSLKKGREKINFEIEHVDLLWNCETNMTTVGLHNSQINKQVTSYRINPHHIILMHFLPKNVIRSWDLLFLRKVFSALLKCACAKRVLPGGRLNFSIFPKFSEVSRGNWRITKLVKTFCRGNYLTATVIGYSLRELRELPERVSYIRTNAISNCNTMASDGI